MKRILLLLVLLVLALPVCAQTTTKKKDAKRATTATAHKVSGEPSKQLMQELLDAWASLDTAKLAGFYSKSSSNVYYDVAPMKYTGFQQYVNGVKLEFGKYQSMKFTLTDDAEVHRAGNMAFGTATFHADLIGKDGSRQSLDARWTPIWQKQGGKWLIVHEHTSVPLQEAEEKK